MERAFSPIFSCGFFPGALPQAGIERAFGPVLLQMNHPFREENLGRPRPLVGDFLQRQRRAFIPAWGNAPGIEAKTP